MISAILLVVAALAPLVSRRLTGDVFGPLALIALTWGVSAALARLEWIPYHPIAAETWRVFAVNLAALAGGAVAGELLAGRLAAAADGATPERGGLTPERWVLPLAAIGLAGLGWYIVSAAGVLGWGGLLDGERLRAALTTYAIPSTFLVAQFFCLIAPMVAGALELSGRRLSWPARLLAAAAALGTVVTTDRTQVFALVSTLFLMWVFARGPALPWRRLLLVGAVVPAILAANFIAVDAWRRNVLEAFELKLTIEGPDSRGTPLARAFWRRTTSLYYYATSSYPAFDRLLADPGPRTGGVLSFHPLARALERARLIGPTPPYIPGFVTVTRQGQDPPAYSNAYSYLGYPLRDFGVAGTVVYSALLGLACGAVFGWGRARRGSPARLLLVGQVSSAIAFLPLFNKFNNTAWWYVLAWTLAPFVVHAASTQRRGARPP